MDTLKDHFIYEYDPERMSDLFYSVSEGLKALHEKRRYVPVLRMDEILLDEEVQFKTVKPTLNIQKEKKKNIISLAKIMIGCFLSQGVKFNDLSVIEDSWFVENFNDIFNCVDMPGFDREYFASVFFNNDDNHELEYYSDYIDRKQREQQNHDTEEEINNAQSRGVVRSLVKTNGHSLLPSDEKAGRMQVAFNPLLIGMSIATIAVITIMAILLN